MAWRIYAAASIGSSHIEAGTPCQDAFAHAVVGDTMLGVVCDGAGSQALSHIGAQAVSSGVVARLQQLEGADAATLGQFSNKGEAAVKRLNGLKFQELFLWLSASMKVVSQSKPGGQVQLPAADSWSNAPT